MIARFSAVSIFAAAMAWCGSAMAQTSVPPPVAPPAASSAKPKPATVFITITTAEGPIVLELESERAPITTKNFLRYVDEKRLDGSTFYRAMNLQTDYGLLQGGVRDPRKLLPPIKHEPTSLTGLSHQTGVVSMARAAEGTAQSDFFIVVGDMSGLDAHPDQPGDNSGFAAFGHVVSGMDVVRKLMTGAISPTLGADNGMKGQMLAAPIKIMSARRTAKPVTPPAAATPVSPTAAPVVTPTG